MNKFLKIAFAVMITIALTVAVLPQQSVFAGGDKSCEWAWNIIRGDAVDKSTALRYWRNHPFCQNQWFPGYTHYWAAHKELMPRR
jgi:hypothetical protein